jgi:hypothetical protein
MLRRGIELLQEDFVLCLSELDPADLLTIEDYDPGIVGTLQAGELSLLVCIDPLNPGTCQRSDRLDVKLESKRVVIQRGGSKVDSHLII